MISLPHLTTRRTRRRGGTTSRRDVPGVNTHDIENSAGATPTPELRCTIVQRARDESGHLTLMILGFAVVLAMVIAVLASASNAYVQRRALVSWADGAVSAAAQSIARDQLYGGTDASALPISTAGARRAVATYVRTHDIADRFDDFRVAHVSVDEGSGKITVELAATVATMPVGDVTSGLGRVQVHARSSAVVTLE